MNSFTTNNAVRFQTFLLLASTAHVLKSAAKYNFLKPDLSEYIDYFNECWERAHLKGDFKQYDEVPGELADCLISLQWLANHQGIALSPKGYREENQQSVALWCDTHFPNSDLQDRILTYLEELAEICVCEGLEKHRAINLLKIAFDTPDLLDPNTAHRNNLEVLENYADSMNLNLADTLDTKMSLNRQRTTEQSATRLKKKQVSFGLSKNVL